MPSTPSLTSDLPVESRPVRALFQALENGRLARSLILSGDPFPLVEETALRLAGRVLGGDTGIPLRNHPDFLTLRPVGKMRIIPAEPMRELVRLLNHSPKMGSRKIALVHDADRMNATSANIFLKTLEEPSPGTTIVLLTPRPGFLLPTIRSRCLHFRLHGPSDETPPDASLAAWLADYETWLEGFILEDGKPLQLTSQVMMLYGLTARFQPLIKQVTKEAWRREKENQIHEGISDDEEVALEEGLRVGIRDWVFAAVEKSTRRFAARRIADGDATMARPLAAAVSRLEEVCRLLRLNVPEAVVLEGFLLSSLRIWGRR